MLPSPDNSLCYARTQLGGDSLLFYDTLVASLQMGRNEIRLGCLDSNRALQIAMLVLRDHPEFYWFANTASAGGFGGKLKLPVRLKPNAALERRAMTTLERLSSGFPESCDDYSKAKAAYAEVATMASYDSSKSIEESHMIKIHSLWGVFSRGTAVCDGFSSALQFLLQHMGILAYRLTGEAISSGKRGSHSWVLAKIDGCFCHIDPTWSLMTLRGDDGPRRPMDTDFDYLCLTDDEIKGTHFADEPIRLPICNGNALNYYRKEGFYLQNWDESAIANIAAKQMEEGCAWVSIRAASNGLYDRLVKTLENSSAFIGLVERAYAQIGKPGQLTYQYEYATNKTLRTLHFRVISP